MRVVDDDVELAAEKLFKQESVTVWIGRRAAVRRQVERLRAFADSMEAKSHTTMYGSAGALERDRKLVEDLRRIAADLARSNGGQE